MAAAARKAARGIRARETCAPHALADAIRSRAVWPSLLLSTLLSQAAGNSTHHHNRDHHHVLPDRAALERRLQQCNAALQAASERSDDADAAVLAYERGAAGAHAQPVEEELAAAQRSLLELGALLEQAQTRCADLEALFASTALPPSHGAGAGGLDGVELRGEGGQPGAAGLGGDVPVPDNAGGARRSGRRRNRQLRRRWHRSA